MSLLEMLSIRGARSCAHGAVSESRANLPARFAFRKGWLAGIVSIRPRGWLRCVLSWAESRRELGFLQWGVVLMGAGEASRDLLCAPGVSASLGS